MNETSSQPSVEPPGDAPSERGAAIAGRLKAARERPATDVARDDDIGAAPADEFEAGGGALSQRLRTWRFLGRHALLLTWTAALIVLDYAVLIFKLRLLEAEIAPARLSQLHRRNAARYRRTAFKLKGGMIKVGQYISARVDVMPREWIEELSLLQDSVEPVAVDYVRATITRELGRPPEEVFASFDPQALAAASFGQVHRAVTHDGDQVAVKVQHAHIERTLSVDLAILKAAVKVFGALFPRMFVDRIYDELSRALRKELEYDAEARHCARIREDLSDVPDVVVPRVYEELCSPHLIVTEFIDGYKVNDREAMAAHGVSPETILHITVDAFVRQIYVHGFFQSDPHPGNLFFMPGRGPKGVQVGIIDFGQVKEVPREIHRALQRSVWAVVMKDEELFVDMLLQLGIIQPRDRAVTAELVAEFSKYIETGAPQEVNTLDYEEIAGILTDFLSKIENIYIPEDLILYGRTVGLLHGLASDLDPNINVFDIVRPHLMRFLFQS